MRAVSEVFRRAFLGLDTDEVVLALLNIDHTDLSEPLRLVLNTEEITSRGNVYLPFYFELTLPDDTAEKPQEARLRVDAVDQRMIAALLLITGAPTVSIEVVLATDPDTVELATVPLLWDEVKYTSVGLEGILRGPEVLLQDWPLDSFSPGNAPGLFKQL